MKRIDEAVVHTAHHFLSEKMKTGGEFSMKELKSILFFKKPEMVNRYARAIMAYLLMTDKAVCLKAVRMNLHDDTRFVLTELPKLTKVFYNGVAKYFGTSTRTLRKYLRRPINEAAQGELFDDHGVPVSVSSILPPLDPANPLAPACKAALDADLKPEEVQALLEQTKPDLKMQSHMLKEQMHEIRLISCRLNCIRASVLAITDAIDSIA